MKKQAYVIIALTSFLFVLFFSHSLLEILDFDWSIFLQDVEKTEKFVFLLLVFSMSMTFLLALFWRGVEELSLRKMQTISSVCWQDKKWFRLQIQIWMPVSSPCQVNLTF